MDIDIDFSDRNHALTYFDHIIATRKTDNTFKNHNSGIYITNIPHDFITNQSTIDYKEAEIRGYFKIDFLNVSLYDGVKNEEHLIELLEREPLWELLENDNFTDKLFHINGYGDLLRQTKPNNIEQLAAVLAMIRPAKRYLIGESWDKIFEEVWVEPDDNQYFFKKSHSIGYASALVVQMNLLVESYSLGLTAI